MKVWYLVIGSWLITALIGVFGLTAWYTIWYYQEPVLDVVGQPGSYRVAVVSGLAAFASSILFSCSLTAFAGRAVRKPDRSIS